VRASGRYGDSERAQRQQRVTTIARDDNNKHEVDGKHSDASAREGDVVQEAATSNK